MSAPSHAAPRVPHQGEVIAGKYQVERALGAGAMGVVVAARHVALGHTVAIKFLTPSASASLQGPQRFAREARAIAALENEHVIRLLDFGALEDGMTYMVMQHLEGCDLAEAARRRGGKLPVADVVDYVIHACVGLAEAHARGIVHRDIKPSNLFLTQRPSGEPLVKVLDFGISKTPKEEDVDDASLTATNAFLGSPLYMSPEQVRHAKSVDHRTDVWSLGVVLFQLASGKTPFTGPSAGALLAAIAADPPASLRAVDPSLPAALDDVIARCLQKAPAYRFASVTELAVALAPFASPRGRLAAEALAIAYPPAKPDTISVLASTSPPVAGAPAPAPPVASTMAGTAQEAPARTAGGRRMWALGGTGVALVMAALAFVQIARSGAQAHAAAAPSATPSAPVSVAATGEAAPSAPLDTAPATPAASAPPAPATTTIAPPAAPPSAPPPALARRPPPPPATPPPPTAPPPATTAASTPKPPPALPGAFNTHD